MRRNSPARYLQRATCGGKANANYAVGCSMNRRKAFFFLIFPCRPSPGLLERHATAKNRKLASRRQRPADGCSWRQGLRAGRNHHAGGRHGLEPAENRQRDEIGRASCRERLWMWVDAVSWEEEHEDGSRRV